MKEETPEPTGCHKPMGPGEESLLGDRGTLCRARAWRHVQQIVSHPMLEFSFLERVMMDHHHLVIIILTDGKSLGISVDLMGKKFTERSVSFYVWYRPEKGLFLRLILQRDHQQFVVTMWIGKLDASTR